MTAPDPAFQNRRTPQIAGPMTLRWLPAFSMMLVSTISYIDRNTLALLAPTILREVHLSNEQYGLIISAFSIAYMVGNPLWGFVLDRIGVKRGMTAAVGLWTVACGGPRIRVRTARIRDRTRSAGFRRGRHVPGKLANRGANVTSGAALPGDCIVL